MPMAQLPADKARELVGVKVVAPVMLTRAALPGMITRGAGTIITEPIGHRDDGVQEVEAHLIRIAQVAVASWSWW